MGAHLLLEVLGSPCIAKDDTHAFMVLLGLLPCSCGLLEQGGRLPGVEACDGLGCLLILLGSQLVLPQPEQDFGCRLVLPEDGRGPAGMA